MSLTGNLEDLPLLDILQIVTYSRKTGFLAIETRHGDGAIVFHEGLVVAAFTPESTPFRPEPGLERGKRIAQIRTRIEIALETLTRLREGQFRFSLTDDTPIKVGERDIADELIPEGINPQGLLLDLARGIDEDRRDSAAALEASFVHPQEEPAPTSEPAVAPPEAKPAAAPPEAERALPERRLADLPATPAPASTDEVEQVDEAEIGPLPEELTSVPVAEVQAAAEPRIARISPRPAAAPATETAAETVAVEKPAILLVDDEGDVRAVLVECFTRAGYQVIEAEDPDAAVKKANQLAKAVVPFVLVCDVGMPSSGGRTFQGGFEVVKKLWKMHLNVPVLMMADRVNAALQARAKQMGIQALVFKPGLSKLDPEQFRADLRAFAARLNRDFLPRLRPAVGEPKGRVRPEPPSPRQESPSGEEVSKEIAVLQERLDELRRQADPTQISLLVMTTAREFFERGILLLVKDDHARGLSGFGRTPRDEAMNLLVRDAAIPLSEPSAFAEAVARRRPVLGVTPQDGKWVAHFYGKIGRFRAASAVILPLLAHREVIALLFGDNPETGREARRLDALSLFIDQAGLALENLFLERKIRNLEGGPA